MELEIPKNVDQYVHFAQENMPLMLEWSGRLFAAAMIIVVGWVAGNWIQRRILGIRRLDPTLAGFLGGFLKYGVLIVSCITVLGQFGVQTASLLAVLGAAGLAIGLAMQGTLSNVAAGAMMLVLRPFNVGDYIRADGLSGTVKSLGLFGTELATLDNIYIFVPNAKIWGADIWNYSRNELRRQDIAVGISYHDDIGKAFNALKAVMAADNRIIISEEDKKPEVMVSAMGDFSINLIVRFWSHRDHFWALKWDMTRAVKEALDKEGITIPFPTRTLHVAPPAQ